MGFPLRPLLLAIALVVSHHTLEAQTLGQNKAVRLWADVQAAPPRITLNWLTHTNTTGYTVFRKLKGGSSWGTAIATLGSAATQLVDANVALNTSYEYKVVRTTSNLGSGYGYVNAGIEMAMVESRGKLVLIVDNTFTTSLAAPIAQLQQDLEGDGWTVLRHDVSRTASVAAVKALVVADYNADPTKVKAVFLLGHVPVPMSGNLAPDGHADHYGAWSADVYYGEVNGSWTDNSVNSSTASWPRNFNVPGDGKFDQTVIPTSVELAVGRVDLYDLPAFSQSETVLLSNYLNKLHQWKVKQFTAQDKAVVDDNFTGYSDAFSQNAWRGFGPLVHPNNCLAGDYFTELGAQSYLWSYGCGGGWWNSANGVGTSSQFASSSPQGVFTVLFGSYFGDWDYGDSFLRSALASGKTLTNFWAGYPNWFFHHMGLGETIGYAATLTQNNGNGHYEPGNPSPGRVHIALMGDPTLRMHVVAPPTNVSAASPTGSTTTINWSASVESGLVGYHVYRYNANTQAWERRTAGAVAGLSYADNIAGLSGTVRYMVRALKLKVSYSGSYFNLSTGAFGQIALSPAPGDCLGIPGGTAVPGSPCNDNNACTLNDVWSSACQCAGVAIPCNDNDPCTSDACSGGTCIYTPLPDSDGDGLCNAQDACPNDANKTAPGACGCGNPEPGTACNDGNPNTVNDVITPGCACSGELVDCLGIPGGAALVGTPCNDGNPNTGNDTWMVGCQCLGQLVDCVGVIGGGALPGSTCNDGDPLTVNDVWSSTCVCAGTPVDCQGVAGGSALPGSACNDGNPNTGNDTWSANCLCIGALIDCNGVPGGGAIVDLCGVCGGNNACIDVSVCYALAGPTNPDGEQAQNGNIYNNTGALDLVFDGEVNSWRGNQFTAFHFMNVDVPPGATVVNAHVQFTSRGTSGIDPCALQVYLQNADDAATLGWTPFNYSSRPRTSAVSWSPPSWSQANQATLAQRTPDLSGVVQDVIDRPGWNAGNAMAVFIEGVGRRTSWSWDQDPARAAKLCISYALPAIDCIGVAGGAALPGTPCDDGDPLTGNDLWNAQCACAGSLVDCLGQAGGSALPGSPCDDGEASTGNDTWGSDCGCSGELIDCLGAPGGGALPGTACNDGSVLTVDDAFTSDCLCIGTPSDFDCEGFLFGPALPGTPCEDNDPTTGADVWGTDCLCVGQPLDCEGVPGGAALPGAPCDDNDPATGADQWGSDCMCAGLVLDCEGVPGGSALPGSSCDDGDPATGDDRWGADCLCVGLSLDCLGIPGGSAVLGSTCDDLDPATANDVYLAGCLCAGEVIDCSGVIGGLSLPGTPCDDADPTTGADTWTTECSCVGVLIDCAGIPGGSALPGALCDDDDALTGDDRWNAECVCVGLLIDCEGIAGGTALIGTSCDDSNAATGNDRWNADCACVGSLIDCLGIPGGGELPGVPCDDGDPFTGGDVWSSECACTGLLIDCLGVPGGSALEGAPCDDEDPNTVGDAWTDGCDCLGLVPDCTGVPGGSALPGQACDDGNPLTGLDAYTAACACVGLVIDCLDVPGGPALPGSTCVDDDPSTGNDVWTSACVCIGDLYDCEQVPGGGALPGTTCDDGQLGTIDDTWTTGCVCLGQPVDCSGVVNGSAFIDGCGVCAGGTTGIQPNPDQDADLVLDCDDNCPGISNTAQQDFDGDAIGNLCDNCPWVVNPDQFDDDLDGVGNACEGIGIEELRDVQPIGFHPNPTLGVLRCDRDLPTAREARFYDPVGRLVWRSPFLQTLDIGVLAQGTYSVFILDGTGKSIGRARVVRY